MKSATHRSRSTLHCGIKLEPEAISSQPQATYVKCCMVSWHALLQPASDWLEEYQAQFHKSMLAYRWPAWKYDARRPVHRVVWGVCTSIRCVATVQQLCGVFACIQAGMGPRGQSLDRSLPNSNWCIQAHGNVSAVCDQAWNCSLALVRNVSNHRLFCTWSLSVDLWPESPFPEWRPRASKSIVWTRRIIKICGWISVRHQNGNP